MVKKIILVVAFVLLHFADIATTRYLFNMGALEHGAIELNPLMENMIMHPEGALLKIFVVLAVCYLYLTKSVSKKVMVFVTAITAVVVLGNLYAVALYLWVV